MLVLRTVWNTSHTWPAGGAVSSIRDRRSLADFPSGRGFRNRSSLGSERSIEQAGGCKDKIWVNAMMIAAALLSGRLLGDGTWQPLITDLCLY